MFKSLMWPVITLLIIGAVHFIEEASVPALQTVYTPPVIAAVIVGVGITVGYRTVQSGGNLLNVIVNGAILGLLPVMLDMVGFGMLLGRGLAAGTLAAIVGFSVIFWGAVVGGGFALSKGKAGI